VSASHALFPLLAQASFSTHAPLGHCVFAGHAIPNETQLHEVSAEQLVGSEWLEQEPDSR
jgi:hypothetical protein